MVETSRKRKRFCGSIGQKYGSDCWTKPISPTRFDFNKDGIDNIDVIAYSVLQKNTQGDDMSIAVSIRLPDGLANELTHIADETERPRSFHIQKALESYIADFADVQIALDRLRDQKDTIVSGHELRKSLGL